MATKPAGFTVRHYCQGIGDCHLLRFNKADGKPYWMLIDCGIHTSIKGGGEIMDDIVADIRKQTGGRIDVLVLTHEHTDHISAFGSGAKRFAGFTVGEVWMPWTESSDPQAKKLDQFKQQSLHALSGASRHLHAAAPSAAGAAAPLRQGIDELLNFSFGATGERVRGMREAAAKLSPKPVQYLEPRQAPRELAGVPGVRAFVLAPSRDERYFDILDRVGERYRMSSEAEGLRMANTLTCALAASAPGSDVTDLTAPFEPSFGSSLSELSRAAKARAVNPIAAFAYKRYFGPGERAPLVRSRKRVRTVDANETDQSWRRIDHDWLSGAGALAMQLDNRINNTSLVLAFEIVGTGRVFLFAADAQIGNWLSWGDAKWTLPDGAKVTGPDLLGRTVYYKVGHHGSANATAQAKGLELMTSPDLAAFIPTHKDDAVKVGWGEMPFHSIIKALNTRCGARVVRADDARLLGNQALFATPSGSIQAVRTGSVVASRKDTRRAWVEFDLA